jgi:hypothetical protein
MEQSIDANSPPKANAQKPTQAASMRECVRHSSLKRTGLEAMEYITFKSE